MQVWHWALLSHYSRYAYKLNQLHNLGP